MVGQIVEITDPGHWLGKFRGFLEVRKSGKEIGRVPLDDISTVIISVPGCSLSSALLDHLARRNIPVVVCGQDYLPSSWVLPVQGNNRQFQVMQAQTALSVPKSKRAWQHIVVAKIRNQAEVLERVGKNRMQLDQLAKKVRSGDPDNCEAQAAKIYWPLLFGSKFRRNRDAPGVNATLNYCYAIVRACVARGVVASGLHPSFSLHHRNPQNPLNLVDDLIEPLRPIVDIFLVAVNLDINSETLTPKTKAVLATITNIPVPLAGEKSPLSIATSKMCRGFADYCLGEQNLFACPGLPQAEVLQPSVDPEKT